MTAQEARQITDSTKKDITHVLNSIGVMAKNGYDGASFEAKNLNDVSEIKLKLTELGYLIDEISGFLTVKW
ncbi:MAG TPA: hypothetical protein VFV31_13040 [Chitinophagaceae bacterium]|nr:hypothetical protein [Chitinophagaceae bacterium]